MENYILNRYDKDENGNLISINEVKSGLKCDCFCPVCNSQLVARKGKIKVHHFAHYNSNECESYGESMLHLLAKKIIEENKYLLVPDFAKEVGSYSNFKKIDLTKIEVEKGYNDIKPDIIAWVGDENNFFVEIAVTHKVDYEKLLKIKEYNVSTLEIDLGDYYRTYIAIKSRKKDRTAFLKYLADSLEKRMDEEFET